MALGLLALAFVGQGQSLTAQEEGRERILVPVMAYDIWLRGGNGALWATHLLARNNSSEQVRIVDRPPACLPGCAWPLVLEPESTSVIDRYGIFEEEGILLRVPTTDDIHEQLHFSLVIRDESQQRVVGFVPVVREADFFEGPVEFVQVPLTSEFRVRLRIYDPFLTSLPVTMHVLSPEGETLASLSFVLDPSNTSIPGQLVPGSAVVTDLWSELAEDYDDVRVRIVPDEDRPFWTMFTLTNNITNDVHVLLAD